MCECGGVGCCDEYEDEGNGMTTESLFSLILQALEGKTEKNTQQRIELAKWNHKWRQMGARISWYKEAYRGRSTEALAALEQLQQDWDLITSGRYPATSDDQWAMTPNDLG